MAEQYYSKNPTAKSAEEKITVQELDTTLSFYTDSGVFSKGKLDDGTRILLNALPKLSGTVLDMGAGWGAIGLTLAKKYADITVSMAEINDRAIGLIKKNMALNKLFNCEVFSSDGFSNVHKSYDTIITNPPIRAGKQVIYKMFEDAATHLNENGSLYIVIRVKQGAPSAVKKLNELFESVETIEREKGYHVIWAHTPKQ